MASSLSYPTTLTVGGLKGLVLMRTVIRQKTPLIDTTQVGDVDPDWSKSGISAFDGELWAIQLDTTASPFWDVATLGTTGRSGAFVWETSGAGQNLSMNILFSDIASQYSSNTENHQYVSISARWKQNGAVTITS